MLLFSRTGAFRHASIGAAVPALTASLQAEGARVTHSEDGEIFAAGTLAPFEAVVFLLTSGDVLSAPQQAAFEAWVGAGGGWAGVHSAADTEYDWPFYGAILGAYFDRHPAVQEASVRVEDDAHPATAGIPDPWVATDEWYDFRTDPSGEVRVLLSVDESTYTGGGMGAPHPIAWCHRPGGARAFYSALGHTAARYEDPTFLAHLTQGILWAAGAGDADLCGE